MSKQQSENTPEYRYIYEVAEFKRESTEYFYEEEDARLAVAEIKSNPESTVKVGLIKVDVNSLEFQLALRDSCEKDQQALKDYMGEHCFTIIFQRYKYQIVPYRRTPNNKAEHKFFLRQ
jgi:hypothetical protein